MLVLSYFPIFINEFHNDDIGRENRDQRNIFNHLPVCISPLYIGKAIDFDSKLYDMQ